MRKRIISQKRPATSMKRQAAPRRPDLSVRLGALRLRNPVIVASGVAGYGDELSGIVDFAELGAVVTKTLTHAPRLGNAPPRLAEVPGGVLNSIGLANIGCRSFIATRLPALRKLNTKVIVSVGGFSVKEYARIVRQLEAAGGFHALELNISCPNVGEGGLSFGGSPEKAAAIVQSVRRETARPLLVKLTPHVSDMAAVAEACVEHGADAITVANTYRALSIDIRTRTAALGAGIGGLSGPVIKPLTLANVWDVALSVRAPIIACGGICSAQDALEYILAGATAVQVGSACLRSLRAPEAIARGLTDFCRHHSIASLGELRGTLKVEQA